MYFFFACYNLFIDKPSLGMFTLVYWFQKLILNRFTEIQRNHWREVCATYSFFYNQWSLIEVSYWFFKILYFYFQASVPCFLLKSLPTYLKKKKSIYKMILFSIHLEFGWNRWYFPAFFWKSTLEWSLTFVFILWFKSFDSYFSSQHYVYLVKIFFKVLCSVTFLNIQFCLLLQLFEVLDIFISLMDGYGLELNSEIKEVLNC